MFLFCSIVLNPEQNAAVIKPSALSVLRNRAAVAEELRRLLPKIGGLGGARTIPFGVAAIDNCLPQGGLDGGALHEFVPEPGATAAAFGFVMALLARLSSARPLFLVMPAYGLRDYGRPYGHGVGALGLDPSRLILVETAHRNETLWALEEALHSGAPAAAIGVIDKLDLKSSQRLQLAAKDAGMPLLLLRPAQILEPSAAATRWRVGATAAARDRFGLFARARWHLMLERCRNGRAGEWTVEYDHVAHRFSLAAALADPALPRGTEEKSEKSFRQAS
jgi:protein ImuA